MISNKNDNSLLQGIPNSNKPISSLERFQSVLLNELHTPSYQKYEEYVGIRLSTRNTFLFILSKDKTKIQILPNLEKEDSSVDKIMENLNFAPFNERKQENLKLFLRMIIRAYGHFKKIIKHVFLIVPSNYDYQMVKEIKETGEMCNLNLKMDFFDKIACFDMTDERDYKINGILFHFGESSSYAMHIKLNKFLEEIREKTKTEPIGSDIFDDTVATYLIEDYQKTGKIETNSKEYRELFSFMKIEAEKVKRAMNSSNLHQIIYGSYVKEINRSLFFEICAEAFKKTLHGFLNLNKKLNFQKYKEEDGTLDLFLTGSSWNIPNLVNLIKINSSFEKVYSSEKLDNLILEASRKRIADLEIEEKSFGPILLQIANGFKINKAYIQNVGGNSYFLLSILFMIFLPLTILMWVGFVVIFVGIFVLTIICKVKNQRNSLSLVCETFKMTILCTLSCLSTLPGLLVIFLQLLCISYLEDYAMEESDALLEVKIGVLIIYLCMIFAEVSTGVDTIFYSLKIALSIKSRAFGIISFVFGVLPPLVQIGISYLLFMISIKLILGTSDIVDLIQNFAGLYSVLQFDDIIMNFLDFFPFRIFLDNVLKSKAGQGFHNYISHYQSPEKISEVVLKSGMFEFNYNESFCQCGDNYFDAEDCKAGYISSLAVTIKFLLTLFLGISFYCQLF